MGAFLAIIETFLHGKHLTIKLNVLSSQMMFYFCTTPLPNGGGFFVLLIPTNSCIIRVALDLFRKKSRAVQIGLV